jgi:hypothetical protein
MSYINYVLARYLSGPGLGHIDTLHDVGIMTVRVRQGEQHIHCIDSLNACICCSYGVVDNPLPVMTISGTTTLRRLISYQPRAETPARG